MSEPTEAYPGQAAFAALHHPQRCCGFHYPAALDDEARLRLREALAEWDAIEGSGLADQFRAFIAAGKMADAIRATGADR